ncbi:DUF2188 domain-containing protein [Halarcobacter anaerophilus]|uniref:DUF2188 domain-containing protein n=1 Tax=Halarcobacter anaerophilus TaxID=877500 RepID=UPI0005CB3FFA|nr:DUF2188 domain-containing protein [Halarcobacter anaerophilus]
MDNYHITKHPKGWGLKKEGASRATKVTNTKAEIMDAIKGGAHSGAPSSVKIHRGDGRIQEERTYPRSSDPEITKG